MPSTPGERYDFFLSRRGSVATIAREVTDVLTDGKRAGQGFGVHGAPAGRRDALTMRAEQYQSSVYEPGWRKPISGRWPSCDG
jgi:hypothetical protein